MEDALRLVFIGLGLGSIYGLVGLTLVIVFNATKVINIAQGEFVMLGAILASVLVGERELPYYLSFVIIIGAALLVGFSLNWAIVSPLLNRNIPIIMIIIGTYAGALLINGTTGALTDFAFMGIPSLMSLKAVRFGAVTIVPQYALCILITIGVVVLYWFFLNRTHLGWALKATSLNRDMCQLLGISTAKMTALAFGISAAIGAVAGVAIGPLTSVNALVGFPLMVNGFIAAVLGGMGNPYAAVVGGFVVGLLDRFIAGYFAPGYAQLSTFLLLMVILYIRPYGLFAVKE
ncbi:MAG: branched-chain amino acid ABC transporter permease [Candidatus Tectomicrobia bacterium]|uniref:Branched-chain amino acid ABC transporter permease n=1 Tax=Tectimicrobiota bacterium TaxID=2528274 RepID=A0A933GLD8_UNCTE|nr:branched-chain amino acid ABC transporter permease [Candidatus Tectomicrobia bacterium]